MEDLVGAAQPQTTRLSGGVGDKESVCITLHRAGIVAITSVGTLALLDHWHGTSDMGTFIHRPVRLRNAPPSHFHQRDAVCVWTSGFWVFGPGRRLLGFGLHASVFGCLAFASEAAARDPWFFKDRGMLGIYI